MEEKLLELFKLADLLDLRQDKVYAQIEYSSNNIKKIKISIISKEDSSFIEIYEIKLINNSLLKLDNSIKLLENYINGGVSNE